MPGTRTKTRHRARLLVVAVAFALVAFVGVSAVSAWFLTSPPRRAFGAEPERFLPAFDEVTFPARDGVSLSGWFVPCAGAKEVVVLLHGYGVTRTQMLARARFFHDEGYAALLYDARAHGKSGGEVVSFGWFETRDLLGALDWLRARNFSSFGCVGVSQGGATIALAAADLRGIQWVILESVYPTLVNAIDRRFRRTVFLPGWLAGSLMVPLAEWRLGVRAADVRPRAAIVKLDCPLLVMSGARDSHTRLADAREIFDAAVSRKFWWAVPIAAHVDLYGFAKRDYERHVLDFIANAQQP